MILGTIVKGIGGFYYIDTENGIIECKARGHFRSKNMSPCVGDKVYITLNGDNTGNIDKILPRNNHFIRPPVSNIEELIVVASVQNPSPDLTFIDKMLSIAYKSQVEVKLCFNKIDLDDGNLNEIVDVYNRAGYTTIITSTVNDTGIEQIRSLVKGKVTAFSGFSGVGKSSLLNAVTQNSIMETGEVSERLKRGKHTTRHVELIKFNGGYIVDTPGFSMLDFPDSFTKEDLKECFPEFNDYEELCRFRDCNHTGDSKICAVCKAAEDGNIALSRYNNYKSFFASLSKRKEWKK